MRYKFRVTASRKGHAEPNVNERILGHSADKIAKSIPGLTSKQVYELKTNGRVSLVEDGCDVLIELIALHKEDKAEDAALKSITEPKPGWLSSKKWFRRFW